MLESRDAQEWIAADARNADVLFPYLNGEDLNQRPDGSGARWVIDFGNRSEREAAEYALPFRRLEAQVRAERALKPKAVSDAPWWLFLRSRPAMREAISDLSEVLVIALVSKTVMPLRVPTGQVFSHKLGVFATDSYSHQAALSSSLHYLWVVKYSSTMRTDINYSPSDVFETFPMPRASAELERLGRLLEQTRREVMIQRNLGLTRLYNLVNDPVCADDDVLRLREIHAEVDRAAVAAYGWDDVELDHGFHTYRQALRYSIDPVARAEVLDRLLAENHSRARGGHIYANRERDHKLFSAKPWSGG